MSRNFSLSQNNIRQAIYNRMAYEWGLAYDLKLPKLLAEMLGKEGVFDYFEDMTPEQIKICKILLSDNGYTYFKMHMARKLP